MKMLRTFGGAFALLALLFANTAHADEVTKGDLTITNAQARPNLPNRPTAAYLVISNNGTAADRLISVISPAFEAAELHTTKEAEGVMRMMPVGGVDVPAGDAAVLKPGSYHIMLFGGAEAYKAGQEFPLHLMFEQAGEIVVTVKVEKVSGGGHGTHSGHGSSD